MSVLACEHLPGPPGEVSLRWRVHAAASAWRSDPRARFPDSCRLACDPDEEHVHSLAGMPVSYAATVRELGEACPMAVLSVCPNCSAMGAVQDDRRVEGEAP